ncbi:MAG: CBS domain-containing protein, partial [Janthinobacterium lividum]
NDRGQEAWSHWQRIFPIVDDQKNLLGLVTRARMILLANDADSSQLLRDQTETAPVTIDSRQTMRQAALIMSKTKHTAFPVLDTDGKFAGILTISDLLSARTQEEQRERNRERVLRVRWPFGSRRTLDPTTSTSGSAEILPHREESAADPGA